ncbi:putative monooxygenase FAD-binding protein [Botryosphaeria dothidea]|uniref:Monooxygenase FAD-binding protein n=1 Tax=Botryosphaeria dothidea TaxID=55169 RepID=A0A8H4JAF1_9PEZI|nr:putative monooxygenase FAD-binding protein [Botryosphaeria dothidea]
MTTQVDHVPPSEDYVFPMFNGATGEYIYGVPAPNSLRIRRKAFVKMLGEGIDVQYGKRLVSLDATSGPGVTATFADGSTASASLLVGADGAHSAVRKQLLGPEKAAATLSPLLMNITICKLPVELIKEFQKFHFRICALFHPDGSLFFVSVHDAYDKPDPADWDFMVGMFWPQEPPINPLQGRDSIDIIREIKRRMAAGGWAEPWTSIAAAIDESQPAYSSFISYWETKRWDDNPARGKVTLMGDAAHPMPPHRGSGLGNAIQDVKILAEEMQAMKSRDAKALREAVVRYEEEMWPRGAETVRVTVETAKQSQSLEGLKKSSYFTKDLSDRVA